MPFQMKVQPIDVECEAPREQVKPVLKSRLKRLFDRQFASVLRNSFSVEKSTAVEAQYGKEGGGTDHFEPSSVCLAKMVQNFIEESSEKPSAAKCGRNRCNCFNANSNDSSDDEFDVFGGFAESLSGGSFSDAGDVLKSLIPCASVAERNLLADTAKIAEKNKSTKRKDDLRKIVTESLSSLGYDASICKSKWEKSASYPAGEYEYIDVIVEGERLLIDVDFRSEFEIARSTGTYKAILQSLPYIFVGKADRLGQIVSIVSEAAEQSLKKKGMHIAPWRKAEYMRAKWLSPFSRDKSDAVSDVQAEAEQQGDGGELALIFSEKTSPSEGGAGEAESPTEQEKEEHGEDEEKNLNKHEKVEAGLPVAIWQPPAIKPRSVERGAKVVTGLASLLREKA